MYSFEDILNLYKPSLDAHECNFLYQRKNCKKHGHFKKKINRLTNEIIYEIRIDKYDIDSAKIYTFIHEWAHMYNQHLDNKDLTYAQKEYVAHSVAMYTIKYLGLDEIIKKSNLQQKWDINSYGELWMKNRQISQKKIIIMQKQIKRSIEYSEKMYNR